MFTTRYHGTVRLKYKAAVVWNFVRNFSYLSIVFWVDGITIVLPRYNYCRVLPFYSRYYQSVTRPSFTNNINGFCIRNLKIASVLDYWFWYVVTLIFSKFFDVSFKNKTFLQWQPTEYQNIGNYYFFIYHFAN